MEQSTRIRGNFLGAAILVIIYTIYILFNISTIPKSSAITLLVILNALLIVLLYFAFPSYHSAINTFSRARRNR